MTTPAEIGRFIDEEVRPGFAGRKFRSPQEATDAIELAVRQRFADVDDLTIYQGAMIAMEVAIADVEFKRATGGVA